MSKINQIMHKIHFFGVLLWLVWDVIIYNGVVELLPDVYTEKGSINLCEKIILVAIGIGIALIFLIKPTDKKRFGALVAWEGVVPCVLFLIDIIFFDSFYSFGGMFPGFEALGIWLLIVFFVILTLVMSISLCIWYVIKGKHGTLEYVGCYREDKLVTKIIDVFDLLVVIGMLAFAACFIATKLSEKMFETNEKNIQELNEKYATEYYDANNEYTEEDLDFDAYSYASFCEILVENESEAESTLESFKESLKSEQDIKVYKAIVKGKDNLQELLSDCSLESGISKINERIKYDYKNKSVSFYYEMAIIKNNAVVNYWAVVTFDEDMNIDIKYVGDDN